MKISLNWLQDYIDISEFLPQKNGKPENLAELLTQAGLEVEEIINKAQDLKFVVVGCILEKDKHPNADKLSLCKVTTGEGVVHQIVCGAQNHKAHDKVVLALPGAVLPGNFAIKKSAVRGVESGGMLCSLKELGFAKESEGIYILPENAPVGKSFAEFMGLDDVVFEIKVTPNRADCLSHYGLAREIAAVLKREIKAIRPEPKISSESTKANIKLEVKNSDLCPRYAGRYISGVKVGSSPDWLKRRLESVGLNSINNVVDVTNYVMMELGQPLHAFDVRFLEGKKIIVDCAQPGEKFKTLDGTELTLKGEELMIRDTQKPVAMAGVVGGLNSGVKDDTTDIFIEAAYFYPMAVRKASRAHGIETDSAYRFSRGVDPNNVTVGMDRAVELILQVAGGVAYSDNHDIYPNPLIKNAIEISVQTISDRLGYSCDESLLKDYLHHLGCKAEYLSNGHYRVVPPSFRFDISMDMDLVEEYARLNGYDKIPESLPTFALAPEFHNKGFILDYKVSDLLRSSGFSQAMNYAFVSRTQQNKFLGNTNNFLACGLKVDSEPIAIMNPLNEDINVMRSSLSLGLFKNLNYNFHQGNHFGRLFELGSTFARTDSYQESNRLGLVAWGKKVNLWDKNLNSPVVFEIKAAIENILKSFNIQAYSWVKYESKSEVLDFLHTGQCSILVVEGKKIGYIGTLHPVLLDEEKIRVDAAVGEIDLEIIYKTQPRPYRIHSISKLPGVERDFAFIMSKSIQVGDVMKEIRKQAGGLLVNLEVFDIYQGDKLEAGQKSVAFKLLFQDSNATLQDSQVQELSGKIISSLEQKFSIKMR